MYTSMRKIDFEGITIWLQNTQIITKYKIFYLLQFNNQKLSQNMGQFFSFVQKIVEIDYLFRSS